MNITATLSISTTNPAPRAMFSFGLQVNKDGKEEDGNEVIP